MSSDIKRIGWHGVNGMQDDVNGDYVLHSDHEAEVARLRAEVEKNRVDAERYRWLRSRGHSDTTQICRYNGSSNSWDLRTGVLADQVIDAAMGEGK